MHNDPPSQLCTFRVSRVECGLSCFSCPRVTNRPRSVTPISGRVAFSRAACEDDVPLDAFQPVCSQGLEAAFEETNLAPTTSGGTGDGMTRAYRTHSPWQAFGNRKFDEPDRHPPRFRFPLPSFHSCGM